jgi:hypothetical protein
VLDFCFGSFLLSHPCKFCCLQRYGPPPSYPNLKIPGLNAPIPPGASFGYHGGGWGKPPVDAHGNPIYGDVFGLAQVGRGWAFAVLAVLWASGASPLWMRTATPFYGDVYGLAQVGRVVRVLGDTSVETCWAWHRWADS